MVKMENYKTHFLIGIVYIRYYWIKHHELQFLYILLKLKTKGFLVFTDF